MKISIAGPSSVLPAAIAAPTQAGAVRRTWPSGCTAVHHLVAMSRYMIRLSTVVDASGVAFLNASRAAATCRSPMIRVVLEFVGGGTVAGFRSRLGDMSPVLVCGKHATNPGLPSR